MPYLLDTDILSAIHCKQYPSFLALLIKSTFSDYMNTFFKVVIPAWIAGIQAPWMV